MSRHSVMALGLLTLALAFGPAPSATAAEPAHGAAAGPDILEFKPSLALSTLLVFVILLLVLWKTAWGPLAKALAERERGQEETLRQVEHARAESERLLSEHRAQMAQAGEQVRAIIEEARRAAQATADDILKHAQAEAEATRDRAKREIGTARDQALLEIWSKTADLAVNVSGKVLAKDLDEADQRRLFDLAMQELPAAPPTNGHGGRTA